MMDRSFSRVDETDDARFYAEPRFVEHIDEGAVAAVVQLHREFLPAGGAILDCMSSWVSHLPPEVAYASVTGLGMNADELRHNPRLNDYVVHDLNREPRLPFTDSVFDGVAICVSIQYLREPIRVLADIARTAKPGAPIVVTFSNRCFPTKAVAVWQYGGRHSELVAAYLDQTRAWEAIVTLDRSPSAGTGRRTGDPLYAVAARRRSDLTAPSGAD